MLQWIIIFRTDITVLNIQVHFNVRQSIIKTLRQKEQIVQTSSLLLPSDILLTKTKTEVILITKISLFHHAEHK